MRPRLLKDRLLGSGSAGLKERGFPETEIDSLMQENLLRYKDLFRRVQAAITDRRELEDGYVFRLDGESLSLPDVAQWISLERLCCQAGWG
jgi:hypothetical protein